jgi:glycosyltransferase involved in cell wall biosynthesis
VVLVMPKVSVVVPNYNHAKFLARRLDSILEQTFQDYEIIFLDDASTDNSLVVFEQYAAHPKIRAIFNQVNSGSPFRQWNRGARETTGEFLWFAESDDFADSRFLEKLIPLLEAYPGVGLAYSQSNVVDEAGRLVCCNTGWTDDLDVDRWQSAYVNDGRAEVEKYLVLKNIIPNASAVLTRRENYLSAGMAPEHLTYCGDWLTWVRILQTSDIAYLSEPLNNFRVAHARSVRRASVDSFLAIGEALQVLRHIQVHFSPEDCALRKSLLARLNSWEFLTRHGRAPWAAQRGMLTGFDEVLPGYRLVMYKKMPRLYLQKAAGVFVGKLRAMFSRSLSGRPI